MTKSLPAASGLRNQTRQERTIEQHFCLEFIKSQRWQDLFRRVTKSKSTVGLSPSLTSFSTSSKPDKFNIDKSDFDKSQISQHCCLKSQQQGRALGENTAPFPCQTPLTCFLGYTRYINIFSQHINDTGWLKGQVMSLLVG